jgi:hypothetical protein
VRLDQAKAAAALKSARIDIDTMRSSIDGLDEVERKVFAAIGTHPAVSRVRLRATLPGRYASGRRNVAF